MNPCGHLFERNYVCNLPENFFLMKKIKVNTIQTYVNIIKQNWPTFLSRPSFYDLLQDLSKRFSHKMICMYIIFIFAIEKRFIRLVDFKNIFSGSDIACQRNWIPTMNVSNILLNILENGCLTIHGIDEAQLIYIHVIQSIHDNP